MGDLPKFHDSKHKDFRIWYWDIYNFWSRDLLWLFKFVYLLLLYTL